MTTSMQAFKPGWFQRTLSLSVFTFSAVAVTLLLIEIVVRTVPFYPDRFVVYDSLTGWRHIPNFSGTYLFTPCLGEYRQSITINSQGLRDIEHAYDRTANEVYRILLLGDSLAAGFEVPFDATSFHQASVLLNEGSPTPVEIINAGHHGYSTVQSLAYYLAEGRRYQPDLVLLLFEPSNDVVDNNYMLRTGGSTYLPYVTLDDQGTLVFHEGDPTQPDPFAAVVNPLHDAIYSFSHLYRLIYDRAAMRMARPIALSPEQAAQELERTPRITAALIDELRAEVEGDGREFGVIVAPQNWQRLNADLAAWQVVTSILDDKDIPYRYPQQEFDSAAASQDLFFTCDRYHWTPAGHALMGTVITEFVTSVRASQL